MDQKFLVFVFSNGGSDLETTTLANAAKGVAIFSQVAHALAGEYVCLSFPPLS